MASRGWAQDKTFNISGFVLDTASKAGVELATVAIKAKGDENILNAVAADADGKFELQNNKPGKYQLLIAFMGYNTKTIPIELTADLNLGKIYISSSVNTLKEAVVVAERAEMTITADKTVFNVAQSPSNQVGNADDLLRNIPGVTVDQDGNVSVTGKQGVKVLVDGRPNAMADNDLPGFLKSLPANSVESIEVINNPSAKYDAEGNAGIINIKLKKGKGDGLNVALSAGYGILNRYNGNININYKKNGYHPGMKALLLWIALAVTGSLLSGASFVLFNGHGLRAADVGGEPHDFPGRQHALEQQTTLTERWELVWEFSEGITFSLWMMVAGSWNRKTPTSRPWIRYAIMFLIALATGPPAVIAFWAIWT